MRNPIVFEVNSNHQVASIHFESVPDGCDYMDIVWGIEESLVRVEESSEIRVVHLSSQCENFLPDRVLMESTVPSKIGLLSRLISGIALPTVAHVTNNAFGVGLEIVLCADVRICSWDSRFTMNQIKDGFIPHEGGTQRLPRIVGIGRALELILTGRVFDAREALEMGLVQYVSEQNDTSGTIAEAVLEAICKAGPVATKYFKEAVKSGNDMTLRDGLVLETDLNVILQSTSDRAEGIASFMEKRLPKFTGE